MDSIRYIFLLVLAFTLQTTWIDFFEISSLKPDLILLALTYIALREGPLVAICMGFGIGFMQDIYHPADLGLNALSKSLIGFAVGYGRSRIVADNIQVQIGLLFGAVLCHDLIYYLGTSAIGLLDVPYFWLRYGLGRAVYTALLGTLFSAGLNLRRYLFPI
jgi:rod shape-determining protein MreD